MLNLGNVRPGSTVRIPFSTFDKDDGSSVTMTNYAAADILVYKDGSTTERASTAGFTATTDFDSKTGKHLAVLDLSDNTTSGFWNAGSEYLVAVDAVTVDGVTTGGWIARFQIGYQGANLDTTIASLSSQTSFTLTAGPAEDDALNGHWAIIHDIASAVQRATVLILDYTGSTKTVTLAAGATFTIAAGDNVSVMDLAPLQPTTLGRTLDVSAGGEAGVDWANIGGATTTVNLSGTTVKTATDVETDTQDIQSRLPAALVSGRIDASVGAMASGVVTATAIAADAIGASELASDAVAEISAAVWAEASRTLTALDEDNTTLDLDATIRAAVGLASANLDTQLGAIDDFIDTEVAAIKAKTDNLPSDPADASDIAAAFAVVNATLALVNAVTARLDTLLEVASGSPGDYRFSADALRNAPAGTGGGGGPSAGAIADAVWDELTSGHVAGGSFGAAIAALVLVLAKLDTMIQDAGGSPGDYEFAGDALRHVPQPAIPTPPTAAAIADAVWDEAIAGHLTAGSTGDYLNATQQIAGNVWDLDIEDHDTPGTTGAALADTNLRGERTVIRGTVDSGATTTSIPTSAFDPAGAAADQFRGRIVIFDNDTATAALRGQATDITASTNAAAPTLTVTALTTAPSAGDTFSVV